MMGGIVSATAKWIAQHDQAKPSDIVHNPMFWDSTIIPSNSVLTQNF